MVKSDSVFKFGGVVNTALVFIVGLTAGFVCDRFLVAGDAVVAPETVTAVPEKRPAATPRRTHKPARERKVEPTTRTETAENAGELKVEAPVEVRHESRHPGGFRLPNPTQIAAFKAMWAAGQEKIYADTAEMFELSEDGIASLKSVIADMNGRVAEAVEALTAILREQGSLQPTPEIQMRAMGELATIVASTYDSIGAILPEERRGDVQKLEVMRLIDPNAFQPMMDLMQEQSNTEAGQ